jgi:hypothetical protein
MSRHRGNRQEIDPGGRLIEFARRDVCDTVRMEYVSRVPRAPLDGLIDDLYSRHC